MADDEELYLANLDEFVNDEDKIVTYKWLSRTLSVPVNKSKQMLYAFVQKQKASKSASHLSIMYIIGGRCSVDGEIVHRYVITQDENLEETKRSFSLVTSLHIYSIQKCKLKDSNSLYTVDYDIQQQHNNESNRWSHVYCSAAVPLADKGVNRGTQRINGLANGEKCPTTKMVNGSCEPGTTQKGTSNLASEQKGKIPGPKSKKGQMSALESMFTAKTSSSKTEKSRNEKLQDANDVRHDEPKVGQGKADINKAGSMKSSFFGKATTVKKASEKPDSTEKDKEVISKKTETVPQKKNDTAESLNQKKRELPPEDEEEEPLPLEISKAIKSDSAGSKIVKGDRKKIQKKVEKEAETTKSIKVGRKKTVINESDEELEKKPKKRRKRTKELPKEESSDDEQAVTNDEPDKKVASDQGSSRSESPLPQQQPRQTENDTARRRKRKRQLKSKTYMNDEGFMVTEKVWESDSTDASDNDLQITNDPPLNEKRPSPAKKTNKKAYTDAKGKSTKQASLKSFFKKS